jgi:hypothetical protein
MLKNHHTKRYPSAILLVIEIFECPGMVCVSPPGADSKWKARNGRPVVLLGDARYPPPRKSKLVVLFEMRPNRGVIDNDRYAAAAAGIIIKSSSLFIPECVCIKVKRGALRCDYACDANILQKATGAHTWEGFLICVRGALSVWIMRWEAAAAAACAHGRATITRDNYIIARSLLKRSNPTLRGLITSLCRLPIILCSAARALKRRPLANWRKITRTLTWQHTHLLHFAFRGELLARH